MSARDRIIYTATQEVTRKLIDQGRVIEAGWQGMLRMVVPKDAPEMQISESRLMFYAGAQHLYGSIMAMLEAGAEETENDMRRWQQIDAELEKFAEELRLRIAKPGGTG